jgi:hypothetical protein
MSFPFKSLHTMAQIRSKPTLLTGIPSDIIRERWLGTTVRQCKMLHPINLLKQELNKQILTANQLKAQRNRTLSRLALSSSV